MEQRAWAVVVAALAGCSPSAMGGVASVTFWDARVEFGVFADGGSGGLSSQGQEAIPLGHSVRSWEQRDGVSHVLARAESGLMLDEGPARVFVSLDLATGALAAVGDNPTYAFERGVAEASLGSATFDVMVHEHARLTVGGWAFGRYEPGEHFLDPGEHTLALGGPLARSFVDVGASTSAINESRLVAWFEITPAPAPGGLALVLMTGLVGAGRRARRRVAAWR